jgi:ornithine racemase
MYPQIKIDLSKIKQNAEILSSVCREKGVSMWAVTKCFCAVPEISQAVVDGGVSMLADSRIINLKKLKNINVPKVLLRLPLHSEVKDVVEYADYSLNSELSTLKLLGEAAARKNKTHKVVVMIDLGDLREGLWPNDVDSFISEAINIKGISIRGFGVNLTCYGGVMPTKENLSKLVDIATEMQKKYNLELEIITGGNSSSFYLIQENRMIEGINNLRLGEVLLLGRETAYGNIVDGLNTDVFVLQGQIIELKDKPSMPIGEIGMDAFGNKPTFEDKGIIKRAIVGVGRQDIEQSGITPIDSEIEILGGSSDHTILNLSNCSKEYKVGDIVDFYVDYGSLLRAMTSEYVEKVLVQ